MVFNFGTMDRVPDGYVLIKKEEYELLVSLAMQVPGLLARVAELEGQLNKKSNNSSKPPSSDGLSKPVKRTRKPSDRKNGGQYGHKGNNLAASAIPDEVVELGPDFCPDCGEALDSELEVVESRQVMDIPPPPKFVVTEYRVGFKICSGCGKLCWGEFPEGVHGTVQYGPNLAAEVVYLHSYHMLPVRRIGELICHRYGSMISDATVLAMVGQASAKLAGFTQHVRELLAASTMAHFDETGMRVAGSLHWFHNASTKFLTLLYAHKNRGLIAMNAMGVLPTFKGVAVHDRWKSYMLYLDCVHAFCNAHILRDLEFLHEQKGQAWAAEMTSALMDAKRASEEESPPTAEQVLKLTDRYLQIVEQALENCPPDPVPTGKRGRKKKSEARNLLEMLKENKNEVLRFLTNPEVPFDNNQAERDVRMAKVKMKVSGCFRTFEGAENFANIRSYISTVKKNARDILHDLASAMKGDPFMPNMA